MMHKSEKNPAHHTALDSLGDAVTMTAVTLLTILFALIAAQPVVFLGLMLW